MPASSIGSLNSWGLYIFAAAALVLILAPQLSSVTTYSRVGADWREVDGIRAVVDSLSPGVTLQLSYGVAGLSDAVNLSGHLVTCSYGNGSIMARVVWPLPAMTLAPSVHYSLSIVRGAVRVEKSV